MSKEEQFFDALRDIFIGAGVEGESGFVNLMRIKTRYYETGVFPRLKEDIDRALAPFPEYREELFDRLYTFFRRYFNESGSIYFRYTPLHERVYEQVYTDDRDVALFWKTHMLYYVKTERLFRSMDVALDGFHFHFDASSLRHATANEKRALVFSFRERRGDGSLAFDVRYSHRGQKTNLKRIRRAIKEALGLKRYSAAAPNEETLTRAFRLFERQSEVDYFINKDARAFLREQFSLWLHRYLFEPELAQETVWSEKRIRQLQALQEIAYKIIDFIAQFEDELARIWNKPKFALDSHYIITLDRIAAQEGGRTLLTRLFHHPGMKQQMSEWRSLGMVESDFETWASERLDNIASDPRYRHLPLDTRHFPDLEPLIIGLFDHLDESLDGWLVHSENYQALNTLLPKFRGRVKCIYIDPPYNTGSDAFLYHDRFRHSSWLSMMENRLRLAARWMSADAAIFMSIDDREQAHLRELADLIFGPDNFVANVIWQKKYAPQNDARWFSDNHDFLVCYAKDKLRWRPFLLPRTEKQNRRYQNPDNDPRGPWESDNLAVKTYSAEYDYPIVTPSGRVVHPPKGACWRVSKERFEALVKDNRIWFGPDGANVPRLKRFLSEVKPGITPLTVWLYREVGHNQEGKQELKAMLSAEEELFSTPKPVRLLERVMTIGLGKEGLALDFFAGSGATAHAIIRLNQRDGGRRKYLLVEMDDSFHTVLLPRIKKAIFSDKWKDGKPQPDGQGVGHFVKYWRLEQYEETLRRAVYADVESPLFLDNPYDSYIFLRDAKMLDNAETKARVVEIDREQEEIRMDLSKLYENIDLAETLSCLSGKWIRRIIPASEDPGGASVVEFEDGEQVDLTRPPWPLLKPTLWW